MEGRQLRDRDEIALDLVGVIGLSAFLLGLVMLQGATAVLVDGEVVPGGLVFDAAAALTGVLGQLAVTLPAALLILAATTLELATGLVLARAVRSRPFDSVADALLSAMVAAVLKDTLLLGTLAAFGLFRAPVLIGIDVAIVAGALFLPGIARHVRPLSAFGSWRDALDSIGSWPIAALVGIVWIGPVILQLASPVVPFIDVLPNYVGPVEHLRTFGWFSPLSATQSPIIGPSRTVLGYDGLLGSLATITNLPGGLAIAGFIAPQTVLVAAGAYRVARSLRDRTDVPIAAWALLAFALSQSFARLADARGTVVVVPLVCLGLALAAESLKRAGDPWRIGRGAVIGLALGSATLVHPVIGFFAIVTVGVAALMRPHDLAADAFVATLTAGLIALPQLATMLGISLPTLALGAWLPIAIAVGLLVSHRIRRSEALESGLARAAELGRYVALVALVGGVALGFSASFLLANRLPDALDTTQTLVLEAGGLLLIVILVGALFGSEGARSPLVLAGLAVGAGAVLFVNVLPSNLGFLGDALRFEVPKTIHYWLSSIAAAGAAVALAHLWTTDRLPWLVRAAGVAAFIAVAAVPVRPEPINAYHLGAHYFAETFAIDLKYAGSGFWNGFPSSRTVVDEPRQELLDALRAEIDAGRLAHDTSVLHVARSFQQWIATPLGVFAGVHETFVSLDPEVSHQTVGGRLYGFEELPAYLADPAVRYVVLEPDRVPEGTREQVVAAGFASIFDNDQGEVFRRAN